jgi:hypothetical protein
MADETVFVIRRSDGAYLGCRSKRGRGRAYDIFVPRYLDAWAFDTRQDALEHFLLLSEHWPMFRFSVIEV